MKTKNLYVLVTNNGDGSSSTHYTFNSGWVAHMEALEESGEIDYEYWCDGDGFHYDTLTVPEECTLESLDIHTDVAED